MALETLKGVTEIGGYKVLAERPKKADGSVDWDLLDEQRKDAPIYVDHDVDMISFRIQNGPIKENGVNGCQVDTLIHAAQTIIMGLNKKFPSEYNDGCLSHLQSAIEWLEKRTKDREARGVEGMSQFEAVKLEAK